MCVQCFVMKYIIFILSKLILPFCLIALRESPVKRRSRLGKMNTGSEHENAISTPITFRNDRVGLHTSPIERRSFDTTPLHSNQSDTR